MAVKFLGDPHLGRTFENGVPLERRGEREKTVWEDFKRSLEDVLDVHMHVCVGDLFDKFTVPNSVVLLAAMIYVEAARQNPDVIFIIMRGNHDASRDADKRSSFDVFRELVRHVKNIIVVAEEVEFVTAQVGGEMYAFVPWHPFKNAVEMAHDLLVTPQVQYDCVVGHWDLDGSGDNLIPSEVLKLVTKKAVTGHVHTPETRHYGDLVVRGTGSMQPYAHGEGPLYITLSLIELASIQPSVLKDRCVRVLLLPGEEAPTEIPDCLQFSVKRLEAEAFDIEVQFDEFDLRSMFDSCLTEVPLPIRDELWEKIK